MNTTTTTTTAAAKRSSTLYMVELAMMIAIILLMSFTPLGYLRTPGLSITLLTIPVAVGAIILGPKGGAVCGFTFGATSFYMAVTGSSAFAAALFNISPAATFIVCIVARVLEGWITGLIFAALHKSPAKKFSYYIASLACPLLNTFFFMGFLCLFFYNTDYIQGIVSSLGVSNPVVFVAAFVGVQGLIEAGIAGNPKAYPLLRGFYDWFNACPYLPELVRRGGQGRQGIIASTRLYFTPVGKPEDLQVVQRYYQENFWMQQLIDKDVDAIWKYPYDRPHCYLILSLESFLDLYMATGDRQYLDAAVGGWELFNEYYELP